MLGVAVPSNLVQRAHDYDAMSACESNQCRKGK